MGDFKTPRSDQWWHSPHKNDIRFGSLLKWLEVDRDDMIPKRIYFTYQCLFHLFQTTSKEEVLNKPLEKHHHSDLKKESGLETFDDQNNKNKAFQTSQTKNKRSREGYKPNATPTAKAHHPLSTKNTTINQNLLPYSTYVYIYIYIFLIPSTNMSSSIQTTSRGVAVGVPKGVLYGVESGVGA